MLQQWQTRQVNRSVLRLLDFLLACTGLVLSCEVITQTNKGIVWCYLFT
jgi:hypothetical protein